VLLNVRVLLLILLLVKTAITVILIIMNRARGVNGCGRLVRCVSSNCTVSEMRGIKVFSSDKGLCRSDYLVFLVELRRSGF
jgi:hypothetical protein